MIKKFSSKRYPTKPPPEPALPAAADPSKKEIRQQKRDARQASNQTGRGSQYMRNTYIDFTDAYANQGKIIEFTHVPSEQQVFFKAFIVTYNETFSSNWKEEVVYGRNDPIFQFQNTVRKITLAFKVPAATKSEAFENLGRISKLAQFLYPYYDDPNNAATIAQSPLIRIKMMNMIASQAKFSEGGREAAGGPSATQYGVRFKDLDGAGVGSLAAQGAQVNSSAPEALLGVVSNLSYAHNLDGDAGVIEYPGGVLPKLIEVNLDFSVIHESPLGWNSMQEEGEPISFATKAFPYGIDLGEAQGKADAERAKKAAAAANQNATRYDQSLEDLQAEELDRQVAEQAKANAIARYGATVDGALSKRGQKRFEKDQLTLARGVFRDKTSHRLGNIQARVHAQLTIENSEWGGDEAYHGTQMGGADWVDQFLD